MEEITDNDDAGAKLSIFCGDESKNIPSSVQTYTPLWEAELQQANGMPNGAEFPNEFAGTMIIARTPTSSAVHTIFSPEQTYDLEGIADSQVRGWPRSSKSSMTEILVIQKLLG